MRAHRLLGFLLISSLALACNFPLFAPAATSTPTALALPSTDTPSVADTPTSTALPAASSAPTSVPTPSVPVVTPNSVNVNCRSGPDVAYDSAGVLVFGGSTQVAGRTEDSSWWYVHNPANPAQFCWIFSGVVTIAGPTGGIPIQALPAAIVTKVTAGADVSPTVTCGGPNTVAFSGSITTNGPAKVKYQWEITGDKTNTTAPETLNFTDAGTQSVPDPGAYTADCGNYKLTLHVLSPNDTSASKSFKIAAP